MRPPRGTVDPCNGTCHSCSAAGAGADRRNPFPRLPGAGVVSPGGRPRATADHRGSGRSQSTTAAATPGRNSVVNVSTAAGAVQVCEQCAQFVATVLVGRRVLCEACCIESGESDAIPLASTAPSDDIPIEPAWIERWLPKLSLAEVRVYLWLAHNSRTARELPTIRRLMRECCLQRRTVQLSMDKLVQHGLVHRVRSERNDRLFLIVRCSSAPGPGELGRVPPHFRPQGRIPAERGNPDEQGGDPTIAPLPNPESQGGDPTIAPLGGPDDPAAEGVLYSRLRTGRDQTLPVRSCPKTGTEHPPPGGVLSAPHSNRSPSRPCGPSTHPPTPVRSSPNGSPSCPDLVTSAPSGARSSSHSGIDTSKPGAVWTGYKSRVIRDVKEQLRQLAQSVDVACTDDDLTEYLDQGARQRWLWKQTQQGAITSPLHVWCAPDRFLRWLGRRTGTNHANRDHNVDAVRRANRETRLMIARQAAELATGKGWKK